MDYGLIGEKLGHSYSKQIHSHLADYDYKLMPLTQEEFTVFMEKKDFKGINITIPYKRDVIPYLFFLDPLAKQIGAVNTVVNRDGKLYGYNTDYYGFLYMMKHNLVSAEKKKILVLGNGGAAQPVLKVLKQLDAFVQIVKYKPEPGTITYKEAELHHADAEIIINTSPVGMYPNIEVSPILLTPYRQCKVVLDLIANPLETKLMVQAKELGIKTAGGLSMLVAQAKYAVEFFLDKTIDDSVIESIIKEIELEMK